MDKPVTRTDPGLTPQPALVSISARGWVLLFGGGLVFVGLILHAAANFQIADAMNGLYDPGTLRRAYTASGWGYILLGAALPLLITRLAIRPRP